MHRSADMNHLDGLNLSRAWAIRAIAPVIGGAGGRVLDAAAADHFTVVRDEVVGDHIGEHWLASFALPALTFVD